MLEFVNDNIHSQDIIVLFKIVVSNALNKYIGDFLLIIPVFIVINKLKFHIAFSEGRYPIKTQFPAPS